MGAGCGRLAFSEVGNSGSKMYVKEAGGSGKQEELVSAGTVLNTIMTGRKTASFFCIMPSFRLLRSVCMCFP